MEVFKNTISGLDLEFEMMETIGEYFYIVTGENLSFIMQIDENGIWKITEKVPPWIKAIEYELGCAIEVKNA